MDVLRTGLSSCTVQYDYDLYGPDRTCCNTAHYLICHTVFYRNYGKKRYGVRYGAKLALPVQNGLRKASPPQNLPFSLPSVLLLCHMGHVLTPHNASLNDPEAGLGQHQLGVRAQKWLA
jgi:hypothetical protein